MKQLSLLSGPDESQMVELANGDVLMESRNNFAVQTGHKSRMTSLSTDGEPPR